MNKSITKQFQPGLRYVFTKKNFIEQNDKMSDIDKIWVKLLNGREVKVLNDYNGCIGHYHVLPEWCKCIGRLSH